MGKAIAYLGGLLVIIGTTLFLIGNTVGGPVVAFGVILLMSGWTTHFNQEPRNPNPPADPMEHHYRRFARSASHSRFP